LKAFRLDVTKLRYANWDELIDYCSYSAMPVGRFVLDVHGEDKSTWASSDTLCAVLQIINHLQDCGKDYRDLNRVYIPQDSLAANGAVTEALSASASSPELLACLHQLARRTEEYFDTRPSLADQIADTRLACEVAVIGSLANKLLALLKQCDPLADKVHLGRGASITTMTGAVIKTLVRKLVPRPTSHRRPQGLRP
jgi:phytoene/squalene synthetase